MEDPVVEDPVVEDPVVEDPVVEDPVVRSLRRVLELSFNGLRAIAESSTVSMGIR
jgi:hypothetical protein